MALAFHEIQFPPGISYGSTGGPGYSTDIVTMKNGSEQRNINYTQPKCKYNAACGVKNTEQIKVLIEFFHARKGKAFGFRYKDWSDYQAKKQYIGTGDGAKNKFQLIKTYTNGGFTTTRTIKKPVVGTTKLYKGDTPLNSGWSIDVTTGVITFTASPANGLLIYADYEFDVPVRFDTDQMDMNLKDFDSYEWGQIPIIELRGNEI